MSNFTPEQIQEILDLYFENFAHRQYIGARYVPIFGRKGETSIEWDNSAPYEPLTIVLYQGNSYTSRQFVPTGVEITNTAYWAETGNYNAQIEQYRQEVLAIDSRVETLEADRVFVFDTVADMASCDALEVGSICHTSGYYAVNDGGAAWYNVTDDATANEMDIITCGSLFAVADFNEIINVKAIGTPTNGQDAIAYIDRAFEISKEKGLKVFVADGEYAIKTPIAINYAIDLEMMPNARFVADENMDYMLYVGNDGASGDFWLEDDYIVKPVIKGGIFDCNNKAEIGIATDNVLQGLFVGMRICNFTDKGIYTHYTSEKPTGASTQFSYIYLWIESGLNNQFYGIYNLANDFNYDHIQIYNCKHGVYSVGGCKFYDVHPWINSADIIENSICFEFVGSGCNLIGCTSDSYANGIKIGNIDLSVQGFRFSNAISNVETITFRCFTCSEAEYVFNLIVSDFYITRAFTSAYTNFYFVDDVLHTAYAKLYFVNVSLSAVGVIKNADVIQNLRTSLSLSHYLNSTYVSIYGGAADVSRINGSVKLNCTLDVASNIASGTIIGTLPAKWKPVAGLLFGTLYSREQEKPIRYQITDGAITILGAINANDRITFDTEFSAEPPTFIIS